jgi:hypothetical protein
MLRMKKFYALIALLLVVCMCGLSSCKSTKKMGCPSYGENKQYYKEKR